MLEVVGYNYQESRYPADHAKYPKRAIFGSENSHAYANWTVVRDQDYVAGQFLWTGIDYLGEAGRWPNRGSFAGLLDLCGFKKPIAWFRQSLWSDQPMVYLCATTDASGGRFAGRRLLESWNWPSNATVTVRCYTTCPEIKLTLNGRALETKHLADADGALSWQVPFQPGVLLAVGSRGTDSLSQFALKTAGPPSRIELVPDVTSLSADGKDICHVEFRVVDVQGVRVPEASNEVTFDTEGPAELLGLENGDLIHAVSGGSRSRPAFQGRGLAILRATTVPGSITLKASSPGLSPATVLLDSRNR
jgi:beta-galactosidase